MDKASTHVDSSPDYLALVIEWDETADGIERELEDQVTQRIARPRSHSDLAFAAGVIGALALVAWGLRRARAR